MPFFSKVFKSKDTTPKKAPPRVVNGTPATKPLWSDAWIRTRVDPEEAAELLRESTAEFKSRGAFVFQRCIVDCAKLTCLNSTRHTLSPLAFPPLDRYERRPQYRAELLLPASRS